MIPFETLCIIVVVAVQCSNKTKIETIKTLNKKQKKRKRNPLSNKFRISQRFLRTKLDIIWTDKDKELVSVLYQPLPDSSLHELTKLEEWVTGDQIWWSLMKERFQAWLVETAFGGWLGWWVSSQMISSKWLSCSCC